MAFSSVDLDAVRKAIARGERVVQFADRSVTYRSIDELLQAEAHIAQSLNTGSRPKQSVLIGDKAL